MMYTSQKDYTGKNVTAAHFLGVITGNRSAVPAGMKVLQSTEKDRVFINFVDHGGPEILGTPYGPYLTKKALQQALHLMVRNKMFKDLVIYVEACESGSMFTGMPTHNHIYVTTASSPVESSWGAYCPPNDVVFYHNKSVSMETCLGDVLKLDAKRGEILSE